MALLPKLESFLWGEGGRALTPEQVARERELATLKAQRSVDTSPVGHWSAGAARMVDALGGVLGERRARKAEEEGMASADSVIAALLSPGASSFAPAAPLDAGGIPDVNVQPAPQADVSGAFAGFGAASGQNFPMSLVQSESGGNWSALNSEGYGGRLQFGKDRLADAARAGVIPAGMTGAQFSQLPPEQQQAVEQWHFADIDRQAERMGLNSFIGQNVAGIPITQDGIRAMAHLGGIGGAAKFLQTGGQYNPADSNGTSLADYAMKHGAGGGIAPIGGAGAPPATGVSPVVSALMQASNNPWVQQKYGPVIQALMGQEMQRQNATFEQQLREQDPLYRAKLAQMMQPKEVDPWAGVQVINGQAVRMTPEGPQVIGDFSGGVSGATPAEIQALEWRAREAGLEPGTDEYRSFILSGGKAEGDEGPAAFQALHRQAIAAGFEPDSEEYRNFMATRGAGLAAEARAIGSAAGEAQASAESDYQTAQNALDLIDSIRNDPAIDRGTGKSSLFNAIPGTAGYDFSLKVEQAKGGAFLTAVQTMKGLGALSNNEGQAATAAITRMSTASTKEGFLSALDDYEKIVRQGLERAAAKGGGPVQPSTTQLSDDDYLKSLGLE